MKDLQKYLNVALDAAKAAAEIIKYNFEKTSDFSIKGNNKGLVTKTDLEAEKAIIKVLSKKSEFTILREESGKTTKNNGPVWIVDPLDGTNNFANSLPLFAVSVSLMLENESLVGVIIDPVNEKKYWATKGNGAFCNGKRLYHVAGKSAYLPSLFLNHGYDNPDRKKFELLANRFAQNSNILKLGTTALELCYVAAGSVDAFICSGDEIWDFAAGIVIAQEAGLTFTDWKGNSWDGKNNHLLVACPELHAQIVGKIKDLQS